MNPFTSPPQRWFRRSAIALGLAAGLSVAGPARADDADAVRATQSALAARGFYYGPLDGRASAETQAALRRFQIREGLPVTGSVDETTRRALGLGEGTREAADAPAGRSAGLAPGSRPGAATTVLPGGAGGGGEPEPAPAARERGGPAAPFSDEEDDSRYLPADPATPPEIAALRPPRPRGVPPPASGPSEENPPAGAPARAARPAEPSARPGREVAPEIARFVRQYLLDGAGEDVERETAYFADRVRYFNEGEVDRRFVVRDTGAYHRRWPERHYQLEGEPQVVRVNPGGTCLVRFRLRYAVQGASRRATGHTEEEMVLRAGGPFGFEIVSVRERSL